MEIRPVKRKKERSRVRPDQMDNLKNLLGKMKIERLKVWLERSMKD